MLSLGLAAAVAQTDDSESEVIKYAKTPATDAIAHLQKRLDSGEAKLTFDPVHGYLPSVLKSLNVPLSSQLLVFSKTSFQRDLISPNAPRALYFNDGVYIGWVQGGKYVEVSSVDPQLGAVFYVLPQEKVEKPKFVRQQYECLQCHSGSMTNGVPGHIMRSVYARADGQPDFRAGTFLTTDQSPMNERWGGWYVTGTCGRQRHMGNVCAKGEDASLDMETGTNVTDLSKFVDVSPYLTRHSDIVAFFVIEHQTHIQNLITKANYHTKMALQYEDMLNRELKRPPGYHSESTDSRIKSVCEPLVKAMLFCGETKLTDPITGTSGFAQQFQLQGPKDKLGRSLRQLDLKTRLLRYPLSWTIYSEAFDGLPDAARNYVYRRLQEILTGKDASPDFSHLSDADRKAILEILRETKAGWTG